MDIEKANIQNLTGLWKIGGKLSGQYIEEAAYRFSIADEGEWPNKLWFTEKPSLQLMHEIQLRWNLKGCSIPIWGAELHEVEDMLLMSHFNEKMTQIAMSIQLEDVPEQVNRLVIQKVTTVSQAETWAKLFHASFGYEISSQLVMRTKNRIDYFIGKRNGEPVGTAALFLEHSNIAGIHSMGIIPDQRRKGYAEELLIHLLNIAKMKDAKYAILQASEMGKGLYLKTGFKEDFIIKTFIKN